MAKLQIVITEDGEGYYIANEDGSEESDACDWGLPVEFNGQNYVACSEDGETVRLFKCSEVGAGDFEAVSEDPDSDEDDSDSELEEGDLESEEDEEFEPAE